MKSLFPKAHHLLNHLRVSVSREAQ